MSKRKKGSRIQNNRDGWKECWICERSFRTNDPKRESCPDCDDIADHMDGGYE